MTQEEYKSKLNDINKDYELKLKSLDKDYAFSNNPFKIGDIVTDHIGSIKIEEIKAYLSRFPYPCCVYFGIEYTKKGKPNKRGNRRSIYQSNILQP
jgi:hypothetical protein